jgi:co-chaperonin GroES (HSP10)
MSDHAEILPAGTKLRMLGDRVLLKPLDVKWSERVIVARHGRPVRGEVMAVGLGQYPIKYKAGPKGPRSLMDYSKHFQPTEVKPGDIVELGGLNVFDGHGYEFPQVIIGIERYLIVTERDVAAVLEQEAAA